MVEAYCDERTLQPVAARIAAASSRTPFAVRAARSADLASIAVLWRQMMAYHKSLHPAFTLADDADERWHASMLEMLGRRDCFVLLATMSNQTAGFCSGWAARNPSIYEARDVGLLSELAVAPYARRCGVGRALMQHARAWFQSRALQEFQLSTSVDNACGRAFWRAIGGEELLVRYRFSL